MRRCGGEEKEELQDPGCHLGFHTVFSLRLSRKTTLVQTGCDVMRSKIYEAAGSPPDS